MSKKPPVVATDDMGNVVSGLPGRTFERKQGCWNCLHADHGVRYHKLAADRKKIEEQAYKRAGMPPAKAKAKATAVYNMLISKAGHLVMCQVGGVDTHFVANKHLCGKWTGQVGVVGSFEGEKFDPLPEELYDRLGENPAETRARIEARGAARAKLPEVIDASASEEPAHIIKPGEE
jgi:hypothetical protein